MRHIKRLLKTGNQLVSSFGESMSGDIQIPRDRLISKASLWCNILLANSTTVMSLTKRQLYSIFDSISLNVNGGAGPIAGIEGGVYYDFLKYHLGKDPAVFTGSASGWVDRGNTETITATTGTTNVMFEVPFYFRDQWTNKNDVSCLLDSRAASSLDFVFSTNSGWKAAQSTTTITEASSNVYLALDEVIATPAELQSLNKFHGYDQFYNTFLRQQKNQTLTTSTGFANSVDMLTGYIHRAIGIGAYDASAADWASAIISQYKIQEIATNGANDIDHVVDMDFEKTQVENSLDSNASVDSGFAVWDAAQEVLQGVGGLNMIGKKNGDLKFRYVTGGTLSSGNDGVSLLYRSIKPATMG